MTGFRVVEVDKDSRYFEEVERLFVLLCRHMERCGQMLPLIPGGEKRWRASMEKLSGGRFGILAVALRGDAAVGFVHGMVRYAPDYLGGQRVGYLTQLYVDPDTRHAGVGRLLVAKVEQWFVEREVHSFELQVLVGNRDGAEFWKRLGYAPELLQMRKFRA